MEPWKARAAKLLSNLILTEEKHPAVIPFFPQKTSVSGKELPYFRRVAPEKHGVSSDILTAMIHDLENEPRASIHSMMILRRGEAICSFSYPGYDVNIRHLSYSMSKTVIGMAIGLLIDEGKLFVEDRVTDFFPELTPADPRFSSMTVDHLLRMSSGIPFAEAGTVTDDRWTETAFASTLSFAPGEKFAYNSMNSYLLAVIVARVSGESVSDYLKKRLFAPLGITNYLWELSPEGIEKGGFGLYLSCESWAKLGQMMLSRGRFGDRQILSHRFVAEAISQKSAVPPEKGAFDYGYQLWVSRENDDFLFNGMFGQNVWVCPKTGIVVALTSGNNELFSDSPALAIIKRYLGGDLAESRNRPGAQKELALATQHAGEKHCEVSPLPEVSGFLERLRIKPSRPFPSAFLPLLGRFAFADNNAGVLPLFASLMQNNYPGGIEEIGFSRVGERLFCDVTESGETHRIEVGIYGFAESRISLRGEDYLVRVLAERKGNSFDFLWIFPELPNRRVWHFVTEGDEATLRLSESPNESVAMTFFTQASEGFGVFDSLIDLIKRRFGEKYLAKKLETCFAPTLYGVNAEAPDAKERLGALSAERDQSLRATRRLAETILSFFPN